MEHNPTVLQDIKCNPAISYSPQSGFHKGHPLFQTMKMCSEEPVLCNFESKTKLLLFGYSIVSQYTMEHHIMNNLQYQGQQCADCTAAPPFD